MAEYEQQWLNIQSPTRVTGSSQSLIDVIITSKDDNKTIDSGVVGISDHRLVYLFEFQKKHRNLFLVGSLKTLMFTDLRKI